MTTALALPKPYVEIDGITLYHGDCREILPLIDADVMLTDPPYGSNYSSGRAGSMWKHQPIANDRSTDCRDAVLAAWGHRPALVFGEWKNPVQNQKMALVWDKGEAVGMGDITIPWKPNWEMIFVLGSGFHGRRTTGVLHHPSPPSSAAIGRLHPNEKPQTLIAELMRKCPPGTIVDPFAGSGTTLVVARDMGRKAVGIEIEERWCDVVAKRLSQRVLF